MRSPSSSGVSHNVIDAAAGLTIYRGDAFGPEYRGELFVGDSQNNLIHRRKLTPKGPTFEGHRADANTEFVRTTDIWFRPVNCINAPDGTIFVLDMSREVIESVHIAHDVVALLDLTSGRDKGRIYRLAPDGFKPPARPRLGQATIEELVAALEHPGGWWRDTASRLIFERQDPAAVEPLRRRLAESKSDVGRMHILWCSKGWARSKSASCSPGWPIPRPACASMPCGWPSRGWLLRRRWSGKCWRWPTIRSRGSAFKWPSRWASRTTRASWRRWRELPSAMPATPGCARPRCRRWPSGATPCWPRW